MSAFCRLLFCFLASQPRCLLAAPPIVPISVAHRPADPFLPSAAPLAGLAGYLAFPTTARSDIMLSFGEDDLLIQVHTTFAQQALGWPCTTCQKGCI